MKLSEVKKKHADVTKRISLILETLQTLRIQEQTLKSMLKQSARNKNTRFKITHEVIDEMIQWREKEMSYSKIVEKLKEKHDITISVYTVKSYIQSGSYYERNIEHRKKLLHDNDYMNRHFKSLEKNYPFEDFPETSSEGGRT